MQPLSLLLALLATDVPAEAPGGPAATVAPLVPAAFASCEERPGRLEHFVLVRGEEVLGLVRVRETRGASGPLFERETRWFHGDLTVYEVEEPERPGPVLVWREVGEHNGRTLLLERREDGSTLVTDWIGPVPPERRELLAPPPKTPLERLARARRDLCTGSRRGSRGPAFDPLAGRLLELTLETGGRSAPPIAAEPDSGVAPENAQEFGPELPPIPARDAAETRAGSPAIVGAFAPRWVVWRDANGTEVERALFLGPVLLAWRTYSGGPWALAVAHAQYDDRLREYENRREASESEGLTKLWPRGEADLR